MYLLDTNIISEFRRAKPHGGVLAWIETVPDSSLFISAVSVGEIQAGIEKTREQDRVKAKQLDAWLNEVMDGYPILPMDAAAFRVWGQLMHRQSDTVIEDAMIAATALANQLTVVTRNIKDFKRFNVNVLNPFKV
jgi:predicted nucleic acid-binding protein